MSDAIRLNALRAYALGQFDNPDLLKFGAIADSPRAQILHIVEFPLDEDENPFHPESPEGREWEAING